jgi:hypothetical protein
MKSSYLDKRVATSFNSTAIVTIEGSIVEFGWSSIVKNVVRTASGLQDHSYKILATKKLEIQI